MTAIETEASEYIVWLQVHNYAETTVTCRVRYLAYFVEFCSRRGVDDPRCVTLELWQSYQQELYEHRKRCGNPAGLFRALLMSGETPASEPARVPQGT